MKFFHLKQKLNKLSFLFITLLVVACGNKQKAKDLSEGSKGYQIIDSTILVDPINTTVLNASEIVDKIEYIQLETKEECIIGRISKIYILDQKIFISDSEITYALYCFNNNGAFIFKISRKGNGPGEYIEISDFVVTEKEIIIYDGRKQNFLYFDLTGKYIRTENVGLYFSSFTTTGDDELFLFSDQQVNPSLFTNPQFSGIIINRKFKLQNQFLSFDIESDLFQKTQIISNNLSSGNGSVYVYQTCDEYIYQYKDQNLHRLYQLNFATKHVNHEILEKASLEEIRMEYSPVSTIWGLESFQVVNDWLVAQYLYNRQAHFLFYNRGNGRTINSSRIVNDVDSMFVCMIPPFYSDGARLICIIEPYLLKKVHAGLQQHVLESIDVNQNALDLNPMIQLLTLK
jgi:hypothetical protein